MRQFLKFWDLRRFWWVVPSPPRDACGRRGVGRRRKMGQFVCNKIGDHDETPPRPVAASLSLERFPINLGHIGLCSSGPAFACLAWMENLNSPL